MAKQYGIYFDAEKCVQCHACEVACKSYNNVEPGVAYRRVVTIWNGSYPNVSNKGYSLSCMHCGEPACEAVCPTGAIHKRAEDGVVVVDDSKCIGCHYCFFACPYGIPQYGSDGTMEKCNMCLDRVEAGQLPACVATCPADALQFGTMDELAKLAAEKTASKLAAAQDPALVLSK